MDIAENKIPKETKYFFLKTSDPNYKSIISKCEAMHKKYRPNSKLSIVLNNAGTLALVKVYNAEDVWVDKNKLTVSVDKADIIDSVYTIVTHDDVCDILSTSEWPNNEDEVIKPKEEVIEK